MIGLMMWEILHRMLDDIWDDGDDVRMDAGYYMR